jgi:MFS family permease
MRAGGLTALRHPDIRRLELGWGLSLVGTFGCTVAMLAYAYAEGGSGLVAAYGVACAVPGALLTPLLMGVTDRVGGATVLTATTATRAALVALAGAVALAHGPAAAVVALAAAAHALSGTFRPTQASLLPWLAHTPAELTTATVTATMAENLAALLGPLLAGAVLAVADPPAALLVSAGGLLLAAASVRRVQVPASERAARPPRRGPLLRELAAGAAALTRIGRPAGMVVLAFAQTLVRGALMVLLIVLALGTLGLGNDSIGWLNAAIGLGGLVGGALAARLVRLTNLGRCFVAGVAGWGAGVMALSGATTGVVAFVALALVGLANAFEDAPAFILMPRLLGHEVAGRALGTFELVVMAGMASGAAVAPVLAGSWGVRTALLVVGAALVVLAVAYALPFAAVDREMPRVAPEADVLRRAPVFAPLPLVVMEQLAAEVEQHAYRDGQTVVREGDPGDRFHVIAEGAAAVTVGGLPRPDLGPGDGFGEIALLRGVPRTATVTARGPLRVLSVTRERFLRDVSGNVVSAREAEALADRHLATDPPARPWT